MVDFCGAHPNNDFHTNGTYFEVPGASPARYRIRYAGDIHDAAGRLTPFTATSAELTIA